MEILIDYLTFSDTGHDLIFWVERLNLVGVTFDAGSPRYGWAVHDTFSGAHLYHDGREGVCLEFSGVGCRFLETLNDNDFDWMALFGFLLSLETVHVSRLDVACDDRDGILSISRLISHVKSGKYISKCRRKIWTDGDEQNLVFGSKTSDTRLRIYNKALERCVEEHWIRAEFQFRNEAALSFLLNLQRRDYNIGLTYGGVLLNYLRFVVNRPDVYNHYDRAPTTKWWQKFCDTSTKIKNVCVGGLEYNYDSLDYFIRHQCASSIKTYLQANSGDLSPLLDIVNDSVLSSKQLALLRQLQYKDF